MLVPAVLGRTGPAPTAAPIPTGVYVAGYDVPTGSTGDVGELPHDTTYNPATGTYRYGTAYGYLLDPTPGLRWWLVRLPGGYGVLDTERIAGDIPMPPVLAAGDVPPTWSADGRLVLWWPPASGGLTSVRITEAGTDRTSTLPLVGLGELAGPVTRVRWRPGGGLLLLGSTGLLGYTDAAGVVTGRAAAPVLATELRLSPDERYGIADAKRVVSLDSGTSVWRAPTGATILIWADPGHVVVGRGVGAWRETARRGRRGHRAYGPVGHGGGPPGLGADVPGGSAGRGDRGLRCRACRAHRVPGRALAWGNDRSRRAGGEEIATAATRRAR